MKKSSKKVPKQFILAFTISIIISVLLTGLYIRVRYKLEKITMEQLVLEKSIKINDVISKLLYKTQALSALVIQNDGRIEDFEKISATIMDDPSILNVLLAPDGIVSDVYPVEGNERVIGYNLFGEGDGNREAIMAKELGQLVFGGPFELVQGGQALVGRLPVYLKSGGENKFWGIVSVTLKYPDVLSGAGLSILEAQGFAYELWRISPDTNQKQTIASSYKSYPEKAGYVEKPIEILNAKWYFRIAPTNLWFGYPETWICIICGLFISFLIALVFQNNYDLKKVKIELEGMICIDPLTEALNRRGLFEKLSSLISENRQFCLIYVDLNKFKQINDIYGHKTGDMVLKFFSEKVRDSISDEEPFARIGGDEFIIVKKCRLENAEEFIENIREDMDFRFGHKNKSLRIMFSVGIAEFPKNGSTADELISYADEKMYNNKIRS